METAGAESSVAVFEEQQAAVALSERMPGNAFVRQRIVEILYSDVADIHSLRSIRSEMALNGSEALNT